MHATCFRMKSAYYGSFRDGLKISGFHKKEILLFKIFDHYKQYFIITIGEVMNSVTGLEFSYTQAPKSMKTVVTSLWYLTTAVGNIIDVFLVELKIAPTLV